MLIKWRNLTLVKFTEKVRVDGSNMLNKMLTEVIHIQFLCTTPTGPFSDISVVALVTAWFLLKSNPVRLEALLPGGEQVTTSLVIFFLQSDSSTSVGIDDFI